MIFLKVFGALEIKPTIFPDRTSQVWRLPPEYLNHERNITVVINWEFESEAELMHVAQLKTLLDEHYDFIHLHVPYLPYARQDKKVTNTTTFALKTFANMINAMRFRSVEFVDVHSQEALAEIKYSENLFPFDQIKKAIDAVGDPILAFPDAGAVERYKRVGHPGRHYFFGEKIRDEKTGEILDYKVRGWVPSIVNSHAMTEILIIDDLCDGGATFKLMADQLYGFGATSVHLYVTHGLFTRGTKTLRNSGIERIFTYKGEVL